VQATKKEKLLLTTFDQRRDRERILNRKGGGVRTVELSENGKTKGSYPEEKHPRTPIFKRSKGGKTLINLKKVWEPVG